MKKYAIYASGRCTRIRKTIEQFPEITKQFKCIVIDEREDLEIKEYFESRGIKCYYFDIKSLLKTKDRNLLLSDFILDILKQYSVDYCFSFGGHILKGDLLKVYNYKIVNFHPGMIPEVIGLHAVDKALEEKKRYIGNTVHFIDEGIDSGPIILQNLILAENFEEYGYDIFLDAQIELIVKTMKLLDADRVVIDNNKARILDADYTISNIYPKFEC